MRHIGTILHISPHGKLIVQGNSNFLPKLKNRVYTKDKKNVGSVIDVFGPVKQPYLSITVFNASMKEKTLSSGTHLYVREKRKRKK